MIKPTRGRVVLFTPSAADQIPAGGEPLAAVIAHVHSDSVINLSVFDAFGRLHARPSVQLLQEGDAKPDGSPYAEWMSYQKGQAAKTEQLEQSLAAQAGGAPMLAAAQLGDALLCENATENGYSFSGALMCIKEGARIARKGWNGKGMWLQLQVPDAHSKMTLPYIYMKTADDNLVPWLASQTDVLAEDWVVLE